MPPKDLFSKQANTYAQHRPTYPKALYDFVLSLAPERETAWDCGAGNGQVSSVLAQSFKTVHATDISQQQLANAPKLGNVSYRVCPAENTGLPNNSVDLITVGQALHWFQHDAFYNEVRRVAKPDAAIAAWTYVLCHITPEIDGIVNHLYGDILDEYWAKERDYVEACYQTIPFPFKKVAPPPLSIRLEYDYGGLMGYLNSWSATNKYIKANGSNPTLLIANDLEKAWGDKAGKRPVEWPIHLLAAKVFG